MTLIERLEQATEGSRELDIAIAKTLGPDVQVAAWPTGEDGFVVFHAPGRSKFPLPHYTTSIDAALTLVPEGWGGTLEIGTMTPHHAELWNGLFAPDGKEIRGIGESAALALCIAALDGEPAPQFSEKSDD